MSIIAPYIHHNIAKRITKTLRDILAYDQESNRSAIKRVNVVMLYNSRQAMVTVERVDATHSGTGVFFSQEELKIIHSDDPKLPDSIMEAVKKVLEEQHYSVLKSTTSQYMDMEFYVLRE